MTDERIIELGLQLEDLKASGSYRAFEQLLQEKLRYHVQAVEQNPALSLWHGGASAACIDLPEQIEHIIKRKTEILAERAKQAQEAQTGAMGRLTRQITRTFTRRAPQTV